MKGPFATLEEARAQALPGEYILARDSCIFHFEGWCVVPVLGEEFYRDLSPWVIWEEVK